MARPSVPKFGAGSGTAYTAVFDQARTGRNGKSINPNEPAENEGSYGYIPPLPSQRNSERPHRGHDENRPRHEKRSSREDLEMRRSNDPPSRQPPYPGQAPARKPPGGVGARGGGEGPPTRPDRDGSNHTDRDGSSHNTDRSPAHPHANRVGARDNRRGVASPTWERRGRQPSGGDEGSLLGSGAPKPRMKPTGPREDPPAKGGALPAFGAWDVKDPNAGDGFTMIFQKLSNEKKEGGPVHIPKLNAEQQPSHEKSYDKHNQPNGSRDRKQSSQPDCGCIIL